MFCRTLFSADASAVTSTLKPYQIRTKFRHHVTLKTFKISTALRFESLVPGIVCRTPFPQELAFCWGFAFFHNNNKLCVIMRPIFCIIDPHDFYQSLSSMKISRDEVFMVVKQGKNLARDEMRKSFVLWGEEERWLGFVQSCRDGAAQESKKSQSLKTSKRTDSVMWRDFQLHLLSAKDSR